MTKKEDKFQVDIKVSVMTADGSARLISYEEFKLLFDPRAAVVNHAAVKQTLPARTTDLPAILAEALTKLAAVVCSPGEGAGWD